jgi:hypothetical protein
MTELPPLPDADYLLAIPDQPYDRGYTTTEDGYSADQMSDYGRQCIEAYKKSLKPMAYMHSDQKYPLLSLVSWDRVNGDFSIPLYRLDEE